jgi:hypothetical protein
MGENKIPPPKRNSSDPDTSLSLGEKRRDWLKKNGGIQPVIKKLIDDAIDSEKEDGDKK